MNLSDLKNGDLLVWRKPSASSLTFPYLHLVRLLCMSDFGHVSIVWRFEERLRHVEATMPKTQVVPVPNDAELFAIPMGLDLEDAHMRDFFDPVIGLPYSIMDAARGLFGLTATSDTSWQCAEQCLEFYRSLGLPLQGAYTPSRLVREVMRATRKPLIKLNNKE